MAGIFCPACGRGSTALAPGPGGRPAAACVRCGSLERHRLLALLLRVIGPRLTGARVLDVAPSPHTTPLLARMPLRQLIGMDFDPAADGRAVDVQASITDLPFADGILDFALCYHVFEHVPDDRRGMAELARALRPTGVALVQVPWWPDRDTDEESGPTSAAERLRRFGQRDHVRYYGRETFDDRLRESGLEVVRFEVRDLMGPAPIAQLGLRADEAGWLVRPALDGDSPPRPPLPELLRGWVADALGADVDRLPDLLPELVAASTAEAAAVERAAQLAEETAQLAGKTAQLAGETAKLEREVDELRRQRDKLSAELAERGAKVQDLRADLAAAPAGGGRAELGRAVRIVARAVRRRLR